MDGFDHWARGVRTIGILALVVRPTGRGGAQLVRGRVAAVQGSVVLPLPKTKRPLGSATTCGTGVRDAGAVKDVGSRHRPRDGTADAILWRRTADAVRTEQSVSQC